MVGKKNSQLLCAIEGHLEDVCHREKWLQRQLYKRKAENKSQCRRGDRGRLTGTSYSVIEKIDYFTSKRKPHMLPFLIKSNDH